MPIYDLSYRTWGGVPTSRRTRWVPIARAGLEPFLRRRAFLFWLILCWMPAVVFGAILYVRVKFNAASSELDAAGLIDANERFFLDFLRGQFFLSMLTSVFVGSGAIANDRRTNALQIYLAKPLRTIDYLAGKGAGVALALALVSLGPALALYLLRVGLDEDGVYLRAHPFLPIALLGAAAILILTMTILSLTVSSMAKSGRAAGIALVMLYIFTEAFRTIAGTLLGSRFTSLLSPTAGVRQGMSWLLGQPPPYDIHPGWSLVALALLMALCLKLLWGRVRAVEVVT